MAMRMAAVVLLVVVCLGQAMVEGADNCDSATTTLLPCIPYVTGPDPKPPADCCGGLSTLNSNSPTCLCQLITQFNGSAAAADSSVNITKAFSLPRDCAVTLKTNDCPALANLPLAPPVGVTPTPTTGAPTGPAAGPIAGPVAGGSQNSGVSMPLPSNTLKMMGVAIAAAAAAVLM